jgi:hypothetical protein
VDTREVGHALPPDMCSGLISGKAHGNEYAEYSSTDRSDKRLEKLLAHRSAEVDHTLQRRYKQKNQKKTYI